MVNRREFLSKVFKIGTATALGTIVVANSGCSEDSIFGGHSAYEIDSDKCDGCGDCLAACGFGAITISDEKATISSSKCAGCSKCVGRCDNGAIARS